MTISSAFKPARGANQKLSATTSTATALIGKGNRSIRFLNVGANVIYVRTYDSAKEPAPTLSTTDTALGPSGSPGSVLVIEKPPEHDTLAYIAETGATTFHAQPGEGSM